MVTTSMKPKPPITICPKHGITVADKNGNCRGCIAALKRLKELQIYAGLP